MENNDATPEFSYKLLNSVVDTKSDNIDIEVNLGGVGRYMATLVTVSNLSEIMNRYKRTGECLFGSYLWMKNMVVVKDLEISTIESVVSDLIASKELFVAFDGPYFE